MQAKYYTTMSAEQGGQDLLIGMISNEEEHEERMPQ